MTQLLHDLKAVRDLLAVPERWTKEAFATTLSGLRVIAEEKSAKKFCVAGAVMRVCQHPDDAQSAIEALHACIPSGDALAFWNDHPERTHTEVLALLDKAVAAEEGRS